MRRLGGSLLLALSAATYFLAPAAEQLLRLGPAKLYFLQHVPDRLDYLVLLGLILVIGLVAGLAYRFGQRYTGVVRLLFEAPFWLMCALGIEHLVFQHLSRSPPVWNSVAATWNSFGVSANDGWFATGLMCAAPVLACLYLWPRAGSSVKPILCGGAAAIWLACGMKVIQPPAPLPESRSVVRSLAQTRIEKVHELGPGNPVVWLILDEWDYDLTFRRQDQKVFAEFGRLRSQSMFFETVHAAGTATLRAIPSLLMGRAVREYRTTGLAGGRFVSAANPGASSEPFPGPRTIFDTAAQFGYRSHIVGWYHPYCRMFANQVESCWWEDLMMPALRPGSSAADRAAAFLRESIELELAPGLGPANAVARQLARVNPMIEQACASASRAGQAFSFLHLPVPHGPFFKLGADGAMIPVSSDVDGYQFGLEAADRALGSLRQAMTKSGVWDDALVVVTSDHPYRYQFAGGYGNGHIPMMIKFPHQTAPVVYSQPFNAVDTRGLVEEFIEGSLESPERALAWLGRSASSPGAGASLPPQGVSASLWR